MLSIIDFILWFVVGIFILLKAESVNEMKFDFSIIWLLLLAHLFIRILEKYA